jgi:transaldolase/glucose-6-phosphate isomerase
MSGSQPFGEDTAAVAAALEEWAGGKLRRLWDADASLWSGKDEGEWLGWLGVAQEQLDGVERLQSLAADFAAGEFQHVLLLGMGGSSLCPEVLARTFGPTAGHPELRVLDSTLPAQVRSTARAIDPQRTLFIASSKSGGTLETNVLLDFFWDAARRAGDPDAAASHFVAITDPGSSLEARARSDGFRAVAHGLANIGGRYSALSDFGMLPAAVMGLDVRDFLERACKMARACGPDTAPDANPGLALGVALGVLARRGRDKLTLVVSPGFASLGAWLEQLVAESTGKRGRGLVPVDGEELAGPERYGDDRIFVYLRHTSAACEVQDAAIAALEQAGHPVVRIPLASRMDLGAEFFRWEFATAVAGSLLGIHPFDQPDVEASKQVTRDLMQTFEEKGALPEPTAFFEGDGFKLFANPANGEVLSRAAGSDDLRGFLAAHLLRLQAGDYFGLNAYVEQNDTHRTVLERIRHAVRDSRRVATTLGYGPRFLHSTGQLHKGGPNRGVFLQITADDAEDLAIPGRGYSFGVLVRAQALGDFDVLGRRGRRALRVHLGPDVAAGLDRLAAAVEQALA